MSALDATDRRKREALYAQQDTMRRRGVALRESGTGAIAEWARDNKNVIVQSPDVYATISAYANLHGRDSFKNNDTIFNMELDAARTAFYFLTQSELAADVSADELMATLAKACHDPAYKAALHEFLARTYVLDTAPPVKTKSFVSPTLHWAKLGRTDASVSLFLDNTRRLVIKAYPFSQIARAHLAGIAANESADSSELVDLANDIAVSYYLIALVRDYEHVATPHFAFIIDWFLGPAIAPDGVRFDRVPGEPTAAVTSVAFAPDGGDIMQYVVAERADSTLAELYDSTAMSFQLLRAILFQVLFSLEAAWQLMGFLHGDLHGSNIMVRFLGNEPTSPYTSRPWAYKRAYRSEPYILASDDHVNAFVEIIDAGRSRVVVSDSRGAPRVVGNAEYSNFSIYASGWRANRSWDVQFFALDMLVSLDMAEIATNEARGIDDSDHRAEAEAEIIRDMTELKSVVITALGGTAILRHLEAARDRLFKRKRRVNDDTAAHRIRTNFWTILTSSFVDLREIISHENATDASSHAAIYDDLCATLDVFQRRSDFAKTGGIMAHFYKPFFFDYLAAGPEPGTGATPSSLLNLPYFNRLAESAASPEDRAGALRVGTVSSADVLRDPYGKV